MEKKYVLEMDISTYPGDGYWDEIKELLNGHLDEEIMIKDITLEEARKLIEIYKTKTIELAPKTEYVHFSYDLYIRRHALSKFDNEKYDINVNCDLFENCMFTYYGKDYETDEQNTYGSD